MKDLVKLEDKAFKLYLKHDGACVDLLNELKKNMKDFPKHILNDLGCFYQSGDGITINDGSHYNYSVGAIIKIIKQNGFITYEQFKQTSI